jgi:hypothetical protein
MIYLGDKGSGLNTHGFKAPAALGLLRAIKQAKARGGRYQELRPIAAGRRGGRCWAMNWLRGSLGEDQVCALLDPRNRRAQPE